MEYGCGVAVQKENLRDYLDYKKEQSDSLKIHHIEIHVETLSESLEF